MGQAVVEARRTSAGSPANFTRLWAASGLSNLADGVGLTAAPLLAATLTRDPLLVSMLTIAQRLPWFLFTLVSGVLVDRLDRRRVMAGVNGLRFALLTGLALIVLQGWATLPILYLIFFLLGTIETLFDNAAVAILPAIVEQKQLEKANGRLMGTSSLANELVGPPLGSWLFSTFRSTSFLAASLAYGASSLLMNRVQGSFLPRSIETRSVTREIQEGWRWFWHHRLLRTLGFFAAVFNLVSSATMSVFVLYAQDVLGISEAAYGIIIASGAVGGILGSLGTKRLSDWFGPGWVLFADAVISGLAFLAIGLFPHPVIVGAMFALISMSSMFGNVIIISLRQAIIPDRLLGRVTSAYRMLVLGALPVGALIGGLVARSAELATPFRLGGLLLVVVAIAMRPIVNDRTISQARAASERTM